MLLIYCLIAGVLGALIAPRISWAIRAWPGHEEFHCDYLDCPKCEPGLKRGCYNAGTFQDKCYLVFSVFVAITSVYLFGFSLKAFISWLFTIACMVVTVTDIRYLIIPDRLSVTACWSGLLFAFVCMLWNTVFGFDKPSYYIEVVDSFIGFACGGGFLWLLAWLAIVLLKKEGMGGGDIKLLAAFGAWTGWRTVVATVIIASFLGTIGGVSSILYHKIKNGREYKPLTHMIPFGPYLCVGFLFIFFCGLEPLIKLFDAYQQWLVGSI